MSPSAPTPAPSTPAATAPGATASAAPAPRPPAPRPPMGGGLAPGGTASLRLPGQHFVASLVFLTAGAAGLVVIAPDLAAGSFLSTRVAGVTHLFTLGWLTTTIFGALYQLLPVALGAPVHSEKMGHASFWTFAPGVALFVAGILRNSLPLHHAGIALLTTGIVLLIANVGLTLPKARARDVTWWAVVLALGFLASTLVLGVLLLHNLHTGFLGDRRALTLAVHLHVALVGWVLVMIVGMSHRLLPMFLLAHGADVRWTGRSLAFLPAGLVLFAAGMLLHWPVVAWAGVALLEAGVVCFLIQARAFAARRMRPRLDVGLRFAGISLGFLAASAVIGPVVLAVGGLRHPRLATTYLILGLLGGVALYVVGQFYKVVPFLAWIARFRGRIGREKVPAVAELYSSRVAHVQLVLMTGGVAIIAAGVAAGIAPAVRGGACAFALGVALFLSQIIRVVTVGRPVARTAAVPAGPVAPAGAPAAAPAPPPAPAPTPGAARGG